MNRRVLSLASVALLVLASCQDQPSAVDNSVDVPTDYLQPALDVLDGHAAGGNEHFFFLPPLGTAKKGFDGVADGGQHPVVEICLRDENAENGCAAGTPLVARFTRDSGSDQDRIQVDDKSQYFVQWRMNSYPPQRDGQYRVRVLIGDKELGHADVIALRQKDLKAYNGDLIAISDNGSFKVAFRIEEDALCAEGAIECATGTEIAGDGQPTVIAVTAPTGGGDGEVAAVLTVNDGAFTDSSGDPVSNVTVSAAVKVGPPSTDILTDDDQEIPFFVEVKTYPSNAVVNPSGPGVNVVICQDEQVMAGRGIGTSLHPQLILYKVHEGVTQRLVSTFGAPECEGYTPPPAPSVIGMLRRGASSFLGLIGPEPLLARRRLHGGLNTVIKSSTLTEAAFSTFGSALGPNAAQTDAVVSPVVDAGDPVPITIQVKNALGQNFLLAGDTLEITVSGANNVPMFKATDNGSGIYTASYTAANFGTDSVAIVLIRNDGIGLGPISGSPYLVTVNAPPLVVTTTADAGAGSLRQAISTANAVPGADSIKFAIPGPGAHVISLASPLPAITEAVVVDGKSQPGYAGSPLVEINGAGATPGGWGLEVQASNTTVQGLALTQNAQDGIFAWAGMTHVRVLDNALGTDGASASGKGNVGAGIRLRSSNSLVSGNVISGNGHAGILVEGSANDTISLNKIGMAADGLTVLPNGGNGITMYDGSANTVISGNLISGNQTGVDLQQSGALANVTGTVIVDNVIGLDAAGNVINLGGNNFLDTNQTDWGPINRGNAGHGVRLINATGTVLGTPGHGNTISGNSYNGVTVTGDATGVTIQANRIGTDPTGSAQRTNGTVASSDGIFVSSPGASGVVIGGTTPGSGNVISGNISDGIRIEAATSDVAVIGNFIGTNASGTAAIGNGLAVGGGCCHSGVQVDNGTGIVIGGGTPASGNLISGNATGLWIGSAPGIQIVNNRIGTPATGPGFVPNGGDGGIALYGTANGVVQANQISGTTGRAGIFVAQGAHGNQIEGNLFLGNTTPAISLYPNAGTGNTIRSNGMVGNGFGIDLNENNHTANDPLDADQGANDLQNYPVLTGAVNATPGSTTVALDVDAAPSTAYTLELFTSGACHASGWGEGAQSVLVTTLAATDNNGHLSTSVNFSQVADGTIVTGTLTDPNGSTSEFSGCVTVTSGPAFSISGIVPGQAAAGFGQTITVNGSGFPASPTVTFTQGATSLNGFVYGGSATQLIVRLPTSGLASSPAGVATDVTVTDGVDVSNTVTIPVSTTPGTPEIIELFEAPWTPAAPSPANVCGGSPSNTGGDLHLDGPNAVLVRAHGLDTSGGQIQFLQDGNTWTLTPGCATMAPVAQVVPIPASGSPGDNGGTFIPGPAQIRIRTQVNGVYSAWSTPVNVTLLPPSPVAGAWTYTGSLPSGQRDQTATLLGNGRVLIQGGTGSSRTYDPNTGLFTATSAQAYYHGQGSIATTLADGRVLITGGIQSQTGAEIYDPGTGSFTATGSMNAPRSYHSATLLADGRVLVAGGQYSTGNGPQSVATAEIYDPGTGTFTTTSTNLNEDRSGHYAVLLNDGRVALLAGSYTPTPGQGAGRQSIEFYDPNAHTFTLSTATLPYGGRSLDGEAAPVVGGRIFILGDGSAQAQLFDPVAQSVTTTPARSVATGSPSVVQLADGRVLVTGGFANSSSVTTADVYDPNTNSWTTTASMKEDRQQHTSTLLADGHILVIGGYSWAISADRKTAEIYEP